jgi:hypothetical protein
VKVSEVVDARAKYGRRQALELAAQASLVVVARGSKVVRFHMQGDRPDDATLLARMLGPTGSLRAPTIRSGKTLVVGFNEGVYAEVFE